MGANTRRNQKMAAAKPKPKVTVAAKPKPKPKVAVAAKPKPKATVAAKPKERVNAEQYQTAFSDAFARAKKRNSYGFSFDGKYYLTNRK